VIFAFCAKALSRAGVADAVARRHGGAARVSGPNVSRNPLASEGACNDHDDAKHAGIECHEDPEGERVEFHFVILVSTCVPANQLSDPGQRRWRLWSKVESWLSDSRVGPEGDAIESVDCKYRPKQNPPAVALSAGATDSVNK
jgi:hypothetical protein